MDMKWDITKLTPSEKRIANFIEEISEKILYYTETKLAEELHVSNATISRFWKKIGFENFKAFKEVLLEREQLTPENKFKNSLMQIQDRQTEVHEHQLSIVNEQLTQTLNQLNSKDFKEAIELIAHSRKLYIHAPASSEGMGVLMKHRLARFGISIEILPKSGHELFESLMHLQKEDVVFLFGFVAMTREAQVLFDYAKEVHYRTIVVTDLLISDFHIDADYIFYTNRGELWEFHSMIAPTFLVESMILSIGQYIEKQSLDNLMRLSQLRKKYKEQLPRLV